MTRRRKELTYTWRILDALRRADDILTAAQIAELAGTDVTHALVTLHNLKYAHAVCVVESQSKLWWFATPDDDTRTKVLIERTPEDKPRAPRRSRKPKQIPVV